MGDDEFLDHRDCLVLSLLVMVDCPLRRRRGGPLPDVSRRSPTVGTGPGLSSGEGADHRAGFSEKSRRYQLESKVHLYTLIDPQTREEISNVL